MRLHKCTGGERCDGGDSGIYAPTALCDTALCDTTLCDTALCDTTMCETA